MAKKTLSIVLYAHQEYMHHVEEEEFSQWHKSLFSLMTDMYLPLLQSFERMERDNVSFHISMVVTPLLCSMLDNPVFKERYIAWLDRLINFGKSEVRRYKGQASLKKNAELYVLKLQNIKEYYTDVLACDVLSKIFYFAENEYIELLGTTATPLFLPHFIDLDDAINAQIEAGLISHKNYFGIRPDGFWLPYMGYVPGLEKNIRMYGYN
ncbi:MAG TPA: hypothetical protein VFC68_02690, partial [Treponemataceae bacterium]|nr:hypothetical protein [Treponemataceae bacterium]